MYSGGVNHDALDFDDSQGSAVRFCLRAGGVNCDALDFDDSQDLL